ncbi:hypothetical protein QD336_02300 [Rhizobium sp. BR 250]
MIRALRVGRSPASCLFAAVFLLLPAFVFPYQAAADDKAPQNAATMAEFVRDNPSCLDFTDGCSVCTVTDGKIICSAPRIQCQVKELTCTRQ